MLFDFLITLQEGNMEKKKAKVIMSRYYHVIGNFLLTMGLLHVLWPLAWSLLFPLCMTISSLSPLHDDAPKLPSELNPVIAPSGKLTLSSSGSMTSWNHVLSLLDIDHSYEFTLWFKRMKTKFPFPSYLSPVASIVPGL